MSQPLIVPHVNRSAGSTAMLEYLARLWPMDATRADLDAVFSQAEPGPHHIPVARRMSMTLANMCKSGQLTRLGSGKFILGPGAKLIKDKPEPASTAKRAKPTASGERAKARDFYTLGAGTVYQPKQWPVNRTGAQDFQAAPSVGIPC